MIEPVYDEGIKPGKEKQMPIYVYEIIREDGKDGEVFELFQNMSDEPLTLHPDTGQKVRRIPARTSIGGLWSDGAMKRSVSDDKLAKHGFTKYVKSGDGTYEKTLGDGPSMISRDGS
jgi:predicted nucleic acid-binding Zn ribbon protein